LPQLSAPASEVHLRLLLPGGHQYTLADPSRAGDFGMLPTPTVTPTRAVDDSSLLSILHTTALVAGPQGGAPIAPPLGFIELNARWTALNAEPAPLSVRVRQAEEKPSWF
jgi:hypothetical protein